MEMMIIQTIEELIDQPLMGPKGLEGGWRVLCSTRVAYHRARQSWKPASTGVYQNILPRLCLIIDLI